MNRDVKVGNTTGLKLTISARPGVIENPAVLVSIIPSLTSAIIPVKDPLGNLKDAFKCDFSPSEDGSPR